MKNKNIRFTSAVLSLALAAGITLASPQEAHAEENNNGEYIENTMNNNEVHYNQYTVKKGENLSSISGKICVMFGEDYSTKYWPVLAYLNRFPRVLQPGEVIIYPDSFESMVELDSRLRAIGWVARYIQRNNVYGDNEYKIYTLSSLLQEIYGDSVCIDPDFVNVYLHAVGASGKYDLDTEITNTNQLFELTDWIPTIEQLEEYKHSK